MAVGCSKSRCVAADMAAGCWRELPSSLPCPQRLTSAALSAPPPPSLADCVLTAEALLEKKVSGGFFASAKMRAAPPLVASQL